MGFKWRHQVGMTKTPYFQSPSELTKYSDVYFEDYVMRPPSDSDGKEPETVCCLRSAGMRHCDPSYHFVNRFTTHYCMHFILSGKAWTNGIAVQAGDVICFDKNHLNNFSTDSKDPCCYAWITFRDDGRSVLKQQAGFLSDTLIYHIDDMTEICGILYDMLYVDHKNEYTDFYLESQFFRLLAIASPNAPCVNVKQPEKTASSSDRTNYINRGLSYIENNYRNPDFHIEDIGPSLGLNDIYFRKLFKAKLGISPLQYLIKHRIESAATMLCSSTYSVREIASLVGFSEYRLFYQAFRDRLGISPTEYRQNHQ